MGIVLLPMLMIPLVTGCDNSLPTDPSASVEAAGGNGSNPTSNNNFDPDGSYAGLFDSQLTYTTAEGKVDEYECDGPLTGDIALDRSPQIIIDGSCVLTLEDMSYKLHIEGDFSGNKASGAFELRTVDTEETLLEVDWTGEWKSQTLDGKFALSLEDDWGLTMDFDGEFELSQQ